MTHKNEKFIATIPAARSRTLPSPTWSEYSLPTTRLRQRLKSSRTYATSARTSLMLSRELQQTTFLTVTTSKEDSWRTNC